MKLWVARDKRGELFVFEKKPERGSNGCWYPECNSDWFRNIDDNRLFPEVTFENSPMEVELKLIEK